MQRTDTKPWYKQFWPWFLIALPGSVVIAGFATLYIAMQQDNTLVSDDYYKDGLAINQVLARDKKAKMLNINVQLRVDNLIGEVRVNVKSNEPLPKDLTLHFRSPTLVKQDLTIELKQTPTGDYLAQLNNTPMGRRYLELESVEQGWRLTDLVTFPTDKPIALKAQ